MRFTLSLVLLFSSMGFTTTIGAAESSDTDVLPLEGITISAEKRREMMARVLRLGMSNARSDRIRDADKLVCVIRKRTGSHIDDLLCGTNAAFNYQRDLNFTLNSAVIAQLTLAPRYTSNGEVHQQGGPTGWTNAFGGTSLISKGTDVTTFRGISRGQIKSLIGDYASNVSDEENLRRLERDMIWTNFTATDGRYGFSADQYTAFVQAYKKIKALENSSFNSESSRENSMAAVISDHGLNIDTYNIIFDRVLEDEDLRTRVLAGLEITI